MKNKTTLNKIKEVIRRIIFSPFWLITSPLAWLLSSDSYKEIWEQFLEITEVRGWSI